MKSLLKTDNAPTTVIIRLMVGLVFFSEGIQKFLFPDKLGTGRFAEIGLPNPDFLAPCVGAFEIACGTLLLFGLFTRFAAIPLICVMGVAMATTKADILASEGFWSMMHAGRTDWAMLMGNIFLLLRGGGRWSLDRVISK
jgi:Predicted membrane protein